MRDVAERGSLTIFVSYVHDDEPLVERFLSLMRPRLSSLRGVRIDVSSDHRVLVGEGWQDEIAEAIASASFGLLCVTPKLLASTYVTALEVPPMLASGTALIPVALEPLAVAPPELRALQELLVFHHRGPGRAEGEAFSECVGRTRASFCDALVAVMVERLRALQERTELPGLALPDDSRSPMMLRRAGDGGAVAAYAPIAPATDVGMVEDLIQRMTPDLAVPSESLVRQARRNAAARTELLHEFGALTGEQIGEEHSQARNRHALAARWRKEGRLFGVTYHGRIVYPGFQFDGTSGELRAVVRSVLSALPRGRMSEWEVALWWTAANGWLGGRRPVDLMQVDPEAIVGAAGRLESSPL